MRLHPKLMLNEKLDYIAEGETLEEQVNRTKEVAQIDSSFAPLMRMAVLETEKIDGLPYGMPDTYKPETDIPAGISYSTVRQEFRRLKNFQINGKMQNHAPHVRETKWLQMCEGLHWKEANILIAIKDGEFLQHYPNMRNVLTELGATITFENKPKKKSTRKPRKKATPEKESDE